MRRIAVAVLVAAVAVGGVGVADRAMSEPERLPLPAPGETVATSLSDGAPVFVSLDDDGVARVISAVSTHLLHLVEWCDDEGVFVERIGETIFDARGRWVNGPAAEGLAQYDAEVDGDTVVVGDLGEPPPRAERSDRRDEGIGGCWGPDGEFGGLPPALPEEVDGLEGLSGRVGERVVVRARVHVDETGMRLCAYGQERCGPEEVDLASTWWPGLFDDVEGWQDGRWLLRVQGPDHAAELASARTEDDLPELLRSELRLTRERPETIWAMARLTDFDAEAGTATLAEVEAGQGEDDSLLPEPDADGTVTLPLREGDHYTALIIEHEMDSLYYYPDEFQRAFEARAGDEGHVPVEATISERGEIHSLRMLRFDPFGH